MTPETLLRQAAGRRLAVFLDYDGTLAPLVERPEDAVLDERTRDALRLLARRHAVAVVSGRDLEDLRARVGIEGLAYAGSHGFDIEGPGVRRVQDASPALQAAAAELERETAALPGVQVERKRFAVSLHYRRARAADVPALDAAVERALARHAGLRRTAGKKIFELRPDVDWDKGHAVLWLIQALGLQDCLPVYIGDDLTDEDAFRALEGKGVGICVQEAPRPTAAQHVLPDTAAVRRLLETLAAAR
jgi:trehalose-phosphatase